MRDFFAPADDPVLADARAAGMRIHGVVAHLPVPESWARSPWLASNAAHLVPFLATPEFRGGPLLLLASVDRNTRVTLDAFFSAQLAPDPGIDLLAAGDLLDLLADDREAGFRAIAVTGVPPYGIVFWRGDLRPFGVPVSLLPPTPQGLAPDISSPRLVDGGIGIALGRYEAAVDALLYELDAKTRGDIVRRDGLDLRFGASLRRLRLTRGLRANNVPGFSGVLISELEGLACEAAGHSAILESLAKVYGVRPFDLGGW